MQRGLRLLAVAMMFCTLAACVRLVGNYDEMLDRQLTEYGQTSDLFLLKMARTSQTPEGSYKNNVTFYDSSRATISTMVLRAESQPNNSITTSQLNNLEAFLTEEEGLHMKLQRLPPEVVSRLRQSNRQAIGAVLSLEIAKKRGEK